VPYVHASPVAAFCALEWMWRWPWFNIDTSLLCACLLFSQEALRIRCTVAERELADARVALAAAQQALADTERAQASADRALELVVTRVRGPIYSSTLAACIL
jgi:hypothetical protein